MASVIPYIGIVDEATGTISQSPYIAPINGTTTSPNETSSSATTPGVTDSGVDYTTFQPVTTSNNHTLITRFARYKDIKFSGTSLFPDKEPTFWFDSTNVNQFCQKSNKLELVSSDAALQFAGGDGIVDISTNAYAEVIATSNNILYLNQNYLTLNISAYGPGGQIVSNDYTADDIIYQTDTGTSSGNTTFIGRVQYFDYSNRILAISSEIGSINAAFSGSNPQELLSSIILKKNATNKSNATGVIIGETFNSGSQIRKATNSLVTANISSYTHHSGSFIRYGSVMLTTMLTSSNAATAVGNTIYITSGSGTGETRNIVAIGMTSNELVLDLPLTYVTSNSTYTFGEHIVDDYGAIAGIFHIPEAPNFNFPAGSRVFTITDSGAASANSNDYLMRATSVYEVAGKTSEITQTPTIIRPQVPSSATFNRNPLAQTFFTPEVNTSINGVPKSNYGIYISSVDLFFYSKPTLSDLQLPVTVQIVEVLNGIPTESILASCTLPTSGVNTSSVPDANDSGTVTKFRFADPVYLKASTEYAIVIKSDSPDYSLFISELGGYILGSDIPRRVSEQPYIGSLFKAQNASTWTPLDNQDIMFRINKCVFNEGTGTVLFKPKNQHNDISIDSMLLHTMELNHKPTSTKYKFKSFNALGTEDSDYTYIPTNIMYNFGSDLTTSIKNSTRRRIIQAGKSSTMSVGVELASSDADISPLVNIERLSLVAYQNYINNGSISNSDITITSGGSHLNVANIKVTISAPDLMDGVQANAYVSLCSDTGGTSGNVVSIIVDEPGSGYITTPTITISEGDSALSIPSATSNATAVISGETDSVGGNCKAKYVSKQIALALNSGDLRVYVDANRPSGTNINVYYKVAADGDTQSFSEKKWQLMHMVSNTYSKDQNQIIELEYRPDLLNNVLSYKENGVTYPLGGKFRFFAIKIVMTAADPTVYPTIYNYRAIATPAG